LRPRLPAVISTDSMIPAPAAALPWPLHARLVLGIAPHG